MDFSEFKNRGYLLSLFWNTDPDFYQGNPPVAYIDGRGLPPHILILRNESRTGELISLVDEQKFIIRGNRGEEKECSLGEIRREIRSKNLFVCDSYKSYLENPAIEKVKALELPRSK